MMGHLEQIQAREAGGEEPRIDLLLHIAGQQEPPIADRPEQHDRHVVDPGPAVGRFDGDLAADRPQDGQGDLVDRQPIAGGQTESLGRAPAGQASEPGRIAGSRAAGARLEDATHTVPVEQPREARDMILVRVRQHDRIDPPIPGRQPRVKGDQQPVRVRSAVDEEAPADGALHEDGVALADIEDRDAGDAGRPGRDHRPGDEDCHG